MGKRITDLHKEWVNDPEYRRAYGAALKKNTLLPVNLLARAPVRAYTGASG